MKSQSTFGYFKILEELGKSSQGTIYLAEDTRLSRRVAIKTLLSGNSKQNEALLNEARIVSKLRHPNLVALYDIGEREGAPYLVYAVAEGETLENVLEREGALVVSRAAQIVCDVLKGIACAHANGVLHLDIKPSNIMITSDGRPEVMGFGIGRSISGHTLNQNLSGTHCYTAPEIITGSISTPRSDLFSVGMLLYRMVTGSTAVEAENIYEILHHPATQSAASPSNDNIHIDERMAAIILKALAVKPEERFPDAIAMEYALQEYLGTATDANLITSQGHSTLGFLLHRMKSKGDFPALANTISEINRIADSDEESASNLTGVILQDFALTNKLLKVVNAVSYAQFGGKISTISKAVVILGCETVRTVAMTLLLLDFMQNKLQAAQVKHEAATSFLAGLVAFELLPGATIQHKEDLLICSLQHNLGKMLATFYFFEESQEAARLIEQGMSESSASYKVLGISFNELGIGIAKYWNFPDRLLVGMQKLPDGKIAKPLNELCNLNVSVNLGNELCTIAFHTPLAEKNQVLKKLIQRYEDALKIDVQQLDRALGLALESFAVHAAILNLSLGKGALPQAILQWTGDSRGSGQVGINSNMKGILQLGTTIDEIIEETENIHDSGAILAAGINDIANTLVGDYVLNDVLQMVVETMYRGMCFNRMMVLVRDNKTNTMRARVGFGTNIEVLLPKFNFSFDSTKDVFHVVLEKAIDIVIEDVNEVSVKSTIPSWYRTMVGAPWFMLLPLSVGGKVVGMFYADMAEANSLHIKPSHLALLKTLRNYAVLAIKQKRFVSP